MKSNKTNSTEHSAVITKLLNKKPSEEVIQLVDRLCDKIENSSMGKLFRDIATDYFYHKWEMMKCNEQGYPAEAEAQRIRMECYENDLYRIAQHTGHEIIGLLTISVSSTMQMMPTRQQIIDNAKNDGIDMGETTERDITQPVGHQTQSISIPSVISGGQAQTVEKHTEQLQPV